MELWKYRELIKHLTLRDIRVRYKQSFLGLFWIILNPFFQMVIMSFIFSHIIPFKDTGIPYPLFLYAGLLPWVFLVGALTSSMSVFIEDAPLIKKIYFPREVLILSTILAKTFDFALSLIIFVILLFIFRIQFTPYMLLFIPIFFIQFLFAYSLALILSAANLFYRDVQYLLNLVLTLWFYLTPVIYATELFPEHYRWIFKINPMSVFINAYRQVLFGAKLPNMGSLAIGVGISVIIFFLAHRFFKKMEGIFADVV